MRKLAVLILLLAAVMTSTVPAHAHARLDRATPAAGSTVASASEVTLSFTEKLEPKFSKVEVLNSAGTRVDRGEVSVSATPMTVGLKPSPAGAYTVRQRLSVDTHKTEGSFSFRVGQ
jgi:methionine-rich copper-binding protein CopC